MWIIGGPAGVDLLAQVGDVELDDVGLAAEVVVPHPVQDLRLRQHPPRVAHEEAQQLELGGGQLDRGVAAAHLVAVLVQGQIADDERRVLAGRGHPGAAQQPAQPRDELLDAERLGDVVVAARGQAGDAVLDGVLGGEEQHRHLGALAAHPAQHLEAVEVGQHDVEDHGVRPELARRAHGGRAVGRGPHLPALVPQRHREQLREGGLVVDDQDPDGAAVRAAQRGRLLTHRAHASQPSRGRCAVPRSMGSCYQARARLCPRGFSCVLPVRRLWTTACGQPSGEPRRHRIRLESHRLQEGPHDRHRLPIFTGWPADGPAFLAELADDNTRAFWMENVHRYRTALLEPTRALAAALTEEFGPPRVFRPHVDRRYRPNADPYRTDTGITVAGPGRHAVRRGAVRAGARGAGRLPGVRPGQLRRYREAVDGPAGEALEEVLGALRRDDLVPGEVPALTGRPRGYPADHPRLVLLRLRGLHVDRAWPAGEWLGTAEPLERVAGGVARGAAAGRLAGRPRRAAGRTGGRRPSAVPPRPPTTGPG